MSKIINSECPEFGYELLSSLPYAYNLYLKGELLETISAFDTKCLYFFSPKHTESNCKRSWSNMNSLWEQNFPNIKIHRKELDWEFFSPPPLKEYYSDKSIKFEKETLVIFNRYNKEWGESPINYIDISTLDKLFNMLDPLYQIVYINLNNDKRYFDDAPPLLLGDTELLQKYPNILTLNDLINRYPYFTINEIQVRVFASCKKYISSNGGSLILSAYFGGENIIFSRKCRELDPSVNSFYRWYHKLGDGLFQHVDDYNDLLLLVKQKWVNKSPLINILIRTSSRPNYFNNCINSIYTQTYKNWNIIVGVDNTNSMYYVQPVKCKLIKYDYKNIHIPDPPNHINYGIKFKYNLYLNDLQNEVKDGYIIYLDDDDALTYNNSLEIIINNIRTNDDLLFWRARFPNRLVPSDDNFGKNPILKDISSISFCFHKKYAIEWTPYKRGDYRISNELYQLIENKIYIDSDLTMLQRSKEDGYGKKDDILLKNKKIIVVSTFWNAEKFLKKNIESIKSQTFKNYIVYLIDDMSTDNSFNLAYNLTRNDNRFRLIKNSIKKYKTENFINIIRKNSEINHNDIIIELDGDDYLSHSNVFEKIFNIYKDDNIWICGSRWIDQNGNSMKYGKADADRPRSTSWNFSHLRTYRAFLFRQIKDSDLRFEGEYFKAACDLGFGIPMLEMSGNEHYYYLDEVTYIYNWHDNQSYSKNNSFGDPDLQKKTAKYIYSLPKYQKLLLNTKNEITQTEKKNIKILSKVIPKVKIPVKIEPTTYDQINAVLSKNNDNIQNNKTLTKEENKPNNRNKIAEMKTNSNLSQIKKINYGKKNSKNLSPNVFGGKVKK